jgi:endonuclease/exonuclease/phosphatase (EEP) superfamily protein YafD
MRGVRRWAAWALRALLILAALALVVVTILPSADTVTWWVRYLDFPRLEFGIGMLLVGVALLLLGPRWLGWVALFGLAASVAYDCFILFPYSGLPDTQQLTAESCPEGNRLRLLEVNVEMTNHDAASLLAIVRAAKPDVAWFQEVDDWWADQLAPLTAELPNVVKQPQPNYFGVELMSRLRLVDPQVKHLTSSADPSVFTGVELPSGQAIRLYAIHPRPPQVGQSTRERAGQVMAMALAARDDTAPHVVMGDMNAVPWEDVIRRAERVGRFLDPRIGRGLFITWNAKSWVLRWPLDQILPGQDFTLISLEVLPPFGSDHRPYLAELCANPAAARDQSPPHLRPGDLEIARTEVANGQNAADKEGYKGRYGPDGTRTSQ